jgi:hypothetical protein
MGSEDLVEERQKGLLSLKSGGSKTKNKTTKMKVDVERNSKEQAAGAESLADVQGTGTVKR